MLRNFRKITADLRRHDTHAFAVLVLPRKQSKYKYYSVIDLLDFTIEHPDFKTRRAVGNR